MMTSNINLKFLAGGLGFALTCSCFIIIALIPCTLREGLLLCAQVLGVSRGSGGPSRDVEEEGMQVMTTGERERCIA